MAPVVLAVPLMLAWSAAGAGERQCFRDSPRLRGPEIQLAELISLLNARARAFQCRVQATTVRRRFRKPALALICEYPRDQALMSLRVEPVKRPKALLQEFPASHDGHGRI